MTRFSFIAYGDTRSVGPSRSGEPPEDGRMLQREHGLVVDAMLKAGLLKSGTPGQFYTDEVVARL